MMTSINFEEFTWFTPKAKTGLSCTIPNQKTINLNPTLTGQLPAYISIGEKEGGKILAIRESDESTESAWKVPKSGSLKKSEWINWLISRGVRLPAKYSITRMDNGWLAVLEEQRPAEIMIKKPNRHPPKDGLQSIAREVHSHGNL